MDKKKKKVSTMMIVGVAIAAVAFGMFLAFTNSDVTSQGSNEKVGLVINAPFQSVSPQHADEIFTDASATGVGRSNAYLFWNVIEPQRGNFDWTQSDVLMGLNEKNDLKVTLYFSVINGLTLGPFPNWIGNPSINSIGEDRLVAVLDEILLRYHIVDAVIIAGGTESHFRYSPEDIPAYRELSLGVYEKLKQRHPDVKFGNSFGLHHVLNKDLDHIVSDLAVGDFVAFSYFPVDNLNDIVKTPQQARNDLSRVFEMVPNKKVAFFEISWSSSDLVGGDEASQEEFMKEMFEFYSENESQIEFMTWYRQYDRPEGTCAYERQDMGDTGILLEEGSSSLGGSSRVIERLNHYICNTGLVKTNGDAKPAWTEFKDQIELLN